MSRLARLTGAIRRTELDRRVGVVRKLHGLAIEAEGPRSRVGELCAVVPPGVDAVADSDGLVARLIGGAIASGEDACSPAVLAEVVGVQPGVVTLMPYGTAKGLAVGSTVLALGDASDIGVGQELIGRVVDGFGRPLDALAAPRPARTRPLRGSPINPMTRPRIQHVLETGIRTIDSLLTLGQGQRTGIFAGSGVGKSTLLGMIARHVRADVNVIALIGERGREVREFIEKHLGAEGLRRSVVVVATADQPALARIRAAHAALSIAEHFREEGKHVLLMMDSITRFAMARREVGLSAGEPPTARGYTPSVFAELPELCERCGTAASGGSITALLTVLVEGDDLNEPVSDALRAILDGHIVLSRSIAHQGLYPAIDLLKSASRLLPDLTSDLERLLVTEAVKLLALLERSRQMVELGAYEAGTNPELDAALACQARLQAWLRQSEGGVRRADALKGLAEVLQLKAQHASQQAAQPAAPQRADYGGNARRPAAPAAPTPQRAGAAAPARPPGPPAQPRSGR
ncbi:MAG: FliI/YscN family ATPase [Anaeromyxobacter sp.]